MRSWDTVTETLNLYCPLNSQVKSRKKGKKEESKQIIWCKDESVIAKVKESKKIKTEGSGPSFRRSNTCTPSIGKRPHSVNRKTINPCLAFFGCKKNKGKNPAVQLVIRRLGGRRGKKGDGWNNARRGEECGPSGYG